MMSAEEQEVACRGYDSVMSSDTEMCARLATGSSLELVTSVLDNKIVMLIARL